MGHPRPTHADVECLGAGSAAETAPEPPAPARLDETGDARLVERAREGDDEAFAQLVGRYERKLLRVLQRLVNDRELAQDLAQETLWRVYRRLDRFDTSRRFGPWLFRVGVNLGLDHLRKRNGPPTVPLATHGERGDDDDGRRRLRPEAEGPDPRDRLDLAQEVNHVIHQIPAAYRTILILRDLEGFSSAEVASIVRRREATVRWKLARAREQFRRLWERRSERSDHGGTV